ncbi:MAG: hypothetical protein OEV00_10545 [Acidobacteriota bacterium]|nr:hypothetical protein [Acidobacteriota bacterium]MDH3785750.1 hypothetical protein [Acidobacteriota bacterium]
MDNHAPSMMKAAMIGGGAAGVASSIPLLGAINCACCALVIAGGFLAGYLQSQEHRRAGVGFLPGSGAKVGVFAAVFFAAAAALVGSLVSMAMPTSPEDIDNSLAQLEESGLDPQMIEAIEGFVEMAAGNSGIVGFIMSFGFWLVVAAIFSTIGGLIAGKVFKHEPASSTPTTVDVERGGHDPGAM